MCADIVELIGAFPVVLCNVYQKTTLARKWFNTNVSLGVIKYVKIQQFARFHMFIEQHASYNLDCDVRGICPLCEQDLLRSVRADQSEQTGLFLKGALKRQALNGVFRLRLNRGAE